MMFPVGKNDAAAILQYMRRRRGNVMCTFQ